MTAELVKMKFKDGDGDEPADKDPLRCIECGRINMVVFGRRSVMCSDCGEFMDITEWLEE